MDVAYNSNVKANDEMYCISCLTPFPFKNGEELIQAL
jgi:hypothetical protein